MAKMFDFCLLYSVIVVFPFVIHSASLNQAEFCVSNNSEKEIACPPGSVISIVEDTLSVCYKEYCGSKHNDSIFGQLKTALWHRCHAKEECLMQGNDIITSMCLSKGNDVYFTYRCIDLNHTLEENVNLGGLFLKNIEANKEIHVRTEYYPKDMTFGKEEMQYLCTFINNGQIQEHSLFLRLQRVSLAANSQLEIDIDGKRYLVLAGSGGEDLIGRNKCEHIPFKQTIVVLYRQCQENTSAIYITMKASTSLHVRCKYDGPAPIACSQKVDENTCIARNVDLSSDNGMMCNCSNEVRPTPEDKGSGINSTSGGADSLIIVAIIMGVLSIIGVLVCVLVYLFIWIPRKVRKQDPLNGSLYNDTDLSPSTHREPQETSDNYTEIDLPPLRHYLPSTIHGMDIDMPPELPLRNTQDPSATPDPNVEYGKVNKHKENKGDEVEMKALDDNFVAGFTEAEEDETVMQENTDLYA